MDLTDMLIECEKLSDIDLIGSVLCEAELLFTNGNRAPCTRDAVVRARITCQRCTGTMTRFLCAVCKCRLTEGHMGCAACSDAGVPHNDLTYQES